MAHVLEVRVPFLDHQLAEWVSGLPSALKIQGAEGKFMLKKALEPYLPQEILYRRKMGFSIPLAAWFRGAFKPRLLAAVHSPHLGDSGLFNMDEIASMAAEHISGQRDHNAALWALLMFEAFLRQPRNGYF